MIGPYGSGWKWRVIDPEGGVAASGVADSENAAMAEAMKDAKPLTRAGLIEVKTDPA
jgi:hypothetical protein